MKRFLGKLTCAALVLGASAISCWADTVDPLHGYCAGAGQCVDNGINSPTTSNPPVNFGFTVNGGPSTGTLLLDILTPNNQPNQGSYNITGTFSGTATLFSATPFTSGTLGVYLGISAGPDNPIGAFIPDPASPGATGFFVFQLSVPNVTLQGVDMPNVSPLSNIPGGIPLGSYIVGFLNQGAGSLTGTANSGAILTTSAPPAVPEPASIVSLGLAIVLGVASYRKRIFRGQNSLR